MQKTAIKYLFENAVHIGHRRQKWNPRMKKFLHGERNGVHIINLEKTIECMDKACTFLAKLAGENKTILFVTTKPQSQKLVEDIASSVGMPYVSSRWIPGLLTNFQTMKLRIRYLADLKEKEASGEFDKYTKKEASKLKKAITILQASLGGVQNLKSLPDCVFVVDVVRDKIAVKEAKVLKLPIVAIVDSNADPSDITYPIPGNDDALKSLTCLLTQVKDAIKGARK